MYDRILVYGYVLSPVHTACGAVCRRTHVDAWRRT